MKKALLVLLFFLLAALPAFAQSSTTVSGTVTDTGGVPWASGTYTFTFVGPPQVSWPGGTVPKTITGNLSGTGTYSVSVPNNNTIVPGPTFWTVTMCPSPQISVLPAACAILTSQFITGVTQTLNVTPNALVVASGPAQVAYATTEVSPAPLGSQIFIFGGAGLQVCTVATGTTCTTWASAGGGGGSTPPGGSPLQMQVNAGGAPATFGGSPCTNLGSVASGPENHDCDTHFKGPNPYTDLTRYGVRAMALGMPTSISLTASINSGSNQLSVSTASCAAQVNSVCFVNGDGVVVYGAGTASGLSTPTSPTVIPSVELTGPRTGFVSNGPAGSTTYNYQIIARTKNGGYTAASAVGSTTTGAASLGVQNVTATCSRANDTVSCATTSAHGFNVGCSIGNVGGNRNTCGEVYTSGFSDGSYNGWWQLSSVADNTHFTWTSAIDTRNNGSTASGTGTIQWWNCNHLSWTSVTGAWIYYIYGRTGASLTLIGVSMPQGTVNTDTTWDDFGSPMMDNYTFPPYIPVTPPVVGASNHLVTTISSGAGTTTLTLAAAAGTTVSGGSMRFDNSPNILAAAIASANTDNQGANGGVLYFPLDTLNTGPTTQNFYVTNSYLNLTSVPNQNLTVLAYSGLIYINETWELRSPQLYADRPFPTPGGLPQFGFEGRPSITVNAAIPGLYIGLLAGTYLSGISLYSPAANGALLLFGEGGFNYTIEDSAFQSSTSTSDYTGIDVYLRGTPASGSAAFGKIRRTLLTGGINPNTQVGSTHTPTFYCNDCGTTKLENVFVNHKGIFYKGDITGGSGLEMDFLYQQGNVQPAITTGCDSLITISNYTLDTVPNPLITGYNLGDSVLCTSGGAPSQYNIGTSHTNVLGGALQVAGNFAFISGIRVPTFGTLGIPSPVLSSGLTMTTGPTRDSSSFVFGTGNDGIFGQQSNIAINYNDSHLATGPSGAIFVTNAVQQSGPTCSVSAGGNALIGTSVFRVVPVWQNGGYGLSSVQTSSPCVTTTGNQTVTISWNSVPGNPKGYDVFGSTSGSNFLELTCPFISATNTTFVWNNNPCGNPVLPTVPAGGPTMLMPGVQGVATPALNLQGMAMGVTIPSAASASQQLMISGTQDTTYDNFNRGSLGSNWTQIFTAGGQSMLVSANQAAFTFNGLVGGASYIGLTFGADQYAQVTVVNVTINEAGTGVRFAAGSGYFCVETTTALNLVRYIAGSRVVLQTTAISGVSGDILRMEAQGPNLTCWRNGVAVLTASDTQVTQTGAPGLLGNDNSVRMDNFSGGSVHPFAQLDAEEDWTQPQHFTQPVTIGATNPVAGTLTANSLWIGGPVASVNNVATVGPGIAAIVAKVDATAQQAGIGNTPIYSVPVGGAGMYRFNGYIVVTQSATTSSTLPQIEALWTDNDTGNSITANFTQTTSANTVGAIGTIQAVSYTINGVVNAKASTAISYATVGYASSGATPMQYAVHIKLEYLGN